MKEQKNMTAIEKLEKIEKLFFKVSNEIVHIC